MKIQDSNVQLSSTHEASRSQELEITSVREFRRIFDDLSLNPAEVRKTERQKIQQMLQSLLDAIMAAMDGKKVGEKFAAGEALPAQPAVARRGAEISWQRTIRETVSESEKTTVCGNGKVTTCDGKVIEFDYALAMERNYASEKVEEESGTVKLSDPLMLSFNGKACELTEDCIAFDLNADGTAEQIPGIGQGSGYLVFDRNGNGKADDGSELFGVASGNGFTDLAKLDDDHNGWIDEADAAFGQLGVWSATGYGSLKDQGVGALYTSTVNAEFSLKTKSNELLGQIRAAGLYLSEAGEVGHLQQVDLVVSDLPAGSEHPDQGQELAA
ncbi:MAG: hypothetical protein CVU33_09430 [Betaproteobacteria bacterium HGW-Betaproteobacteria-6]|jgi:hypothetical protein|nr:MAG: hypothetical protein CVU33_09430 [Betaproteobacteria bacterium HGW-Betaproteobacteria-6]